MIFSGSKLVCRLALISAVTAMAAFTPAAASAQESSGHTLGPKKAAKLKKRQLRRDRRYLRLAIRTLRKPRNSEVKAELLPDDKINSASVPVKVKLKGGKKRAFLLDSQRLGLINLGHAVAASRNRRKLKRVYRKLKSMLPTRYRSGLPSVKKFKNLKLPKEISVIKRLAKRIHDNLSAILIEISSNSSQLPQTNFIADCSSETGFESSGPNGEVPDRCLLPEYSNIGIMKNISFPLRNKQTCVKDQGRRGTCVGHSVAAAVETRVLIDGGSPENLSEQHTYMTGKLFAHWSWRYTDGLPIGPSLDYFTGQAYRLQFENVWNYNRSLNRGALDTSLNTYPNSCTSYTGEMCTGYAFQCQETAVSVGSGTAYQYTYPQASTTAGHAIVSYDTIPTFSYLSPEMVLSIASVYAVSGVPLITSFSMGDTFTGVDSSGYVEWSTATNTPGTHAVLIIGFVSNSELPAGAPAALENGYFIAKNSWGTGFADCGFVYISYSYLKNRGYAWHYLNAVN
ncbi:MAG: hypothetical protein D6719_05295 [Candidatus Dadabacteria bacterium]|nr:MAG: hypothetical protein D6719_05295 [Candidatus Dadabacteria bacterium]